VTKERWPGFHDLPKAKQFNQSHRYQNQLRKVRGREEGEMERRRMREERKGKWERRKRGEGRRRNKDKVSFFYFLTLLQEISSDRLSDKGLELLNAMLCYDPRKRISASRALRHSYWDESPAAKDPDLMPTWPSRQDGRRRRRGNSAAAAPRRDESSTEGSASRDREREGFIGARDRNYLNGGAPMFK
jgi:hypothetical protein